MTASTTPASGRDQKCGRPRKFGGIRKSGRIRKSGEGRSPLGRSSGRSRASRAIVFASVLLTHMAFVVVLLPHGYDLWIVLGAATATCAAAGQVTRTVTLGQDVAEAPGSLLSRMVACWIRAVVANVPTAE